MKRTFAILCAAGLMTTVVAAQQSQPGVRELRASVDLGQGGGMARVALETRVTRGKPYSAEAVTEFVQVLGDGNRITRRNSARLTRDSEGRTRREELGDNGSPQSKNGVTITDPVAGSSWVLDATTRTAFKSPGMFARFDAGAVTVQSSTREVLRRAEPAKVEVVTIPGPRSGNVEQTAGIAVAEPGVGGVTAFAFAGGRGGATPGETTRADLGEQVIEGVTAKGSRTTTVIAQGAIGNEQPITIVSEQWFSEDLGMLVLTRHHDPRVGETTYRVVNISRSEPDRSLFQVPSDYTVQDRPPVMMRQRQQQ